MKPTTRPKTRTEADAPEEVKHLSTAEQRALEAGGEAEHESGSRRERLTDDSKNLGEKSAK